MCACCELSSVNSPPERGQSVVLHGSLTYAAPLPRQFIHDLEVHLLYKNVPLGAAAARYHSASLSSMKDAKRLAHLGKSGLRLAIGNGTFHSRMTSHSSIALFFRANRSFGPK